MGIISKSYKTRILCGCQGGDKSFISAQRCSPIYIITKLAWQDFDTAAHAKTIHQSHVTLSCIKRVKIESKIQNCYLHEHLTANRIVIEVCRQQNDSPEVTIVSGIGNTFHHATTAHRHIINIPTVTSDHSCGWIWKNYSATWGLHYVVQVYCWKLSATFWVIFVNKHCVPLPILQLFL